MTTKPSSAPWADEPFKLISAPSTTRNVTSHYSVEFASIMAHAHNCLIRALNSIFLQAPHIPQSTEPGYVAQDVRDLLFYVTSWVKMVEFHHHAEETYVFPNIAAFTGKPGIMDGPVAQHKEFTAGLESLLDYAQRTTPEDYRWEGDGGMKAIIDAFVPSLMKHLYEEIDVCLGLDWVDSDGLMKCFKDAEKKAEGNSDFGMLYDVLPCGLGASDKTFEGGNNFPPVPFIMPYAIKYWFSMWHRGAWRFNPCDFWGKPVPLYFLKKNKDV